MTQAIALPVETTASNEWLSLAKSTQQSTVLTGRDLPMTMIQAVPKDELTASPLAVAANPQTEQLRLWHQCSRVILESSGKITVRGGHPEENKGITLNPQHEFTTCGVRRSSYLMPSELLRALEKQVFTSRQRAGPLPYLFAMRAR